MSMTAYVLLLTEFEGFYRWREASLIPCDTEGVIRFYLCKQILPCDYESVLAYI